MSEARVSEVSLPEVTVEDLFVAQGVDYSKGLPRQVMVELNLRLLEEAKKLAYPRAIWKEVKVAGTGEQELYLENGPTLKGKLLPVVLGSADSVLLYALTLGSRLNQRVKELMNQRQTLEAFILDSASSAILAKAAGNLVADLEKTYKAKNLSTTFPLGPGHSYWKGLEDVRTIISFLKGEQIGISLTESNLMLPQKSIAMVMGIGSHLPDFKGKTHCDFCHLKETCHLRNIGFNEC